MLPKNLLYQNKLAAAPAQAYSTLISPTSGNGPYSFLNTSSTIIINIPTGGNRVLNPADTYLKFQVDFTTSAASPYLRFGCAGAHGIFQRLRLFHTGVIEDVDDYGLLASKMLVHTCPGDSFSGRQNIMLGTCLDTAVIDTNSKAYVACPTGVKFNSEGQAGSGGSGTYCISLLSIIGTLTDKYLPLFEMGAAPLRLELTTVNTPFKAISIGTNAPTVPNFSDAKISNVELNCAFIDLSDMTIAQLRQSRGGLPIQMVIPSYRTYTSTIQLATTNANLTGNAGSATPQTIVIPARFSSLKSLFVCMQDQPSGGRNFYANATPHLNLQQYTFRVGSQIFPSKPPSSYAEFLMELAKALGSSSDLSAQGLINSNTWISSLTTANNNPGLLGGTQVPLSETADGPNETTKEQAFMIGIDLESYSNSDRSSIYTGFNTLTTDIQFNPSHCVIFGAASGTAPIKYTTFALFDQVLTFENGVATPTF